MGYVPYSAIRPDVSQGFDLMPGTETPVSFGGRSAGANFDVRECVRFSLEA